ncbi:MAG: ribosome assembly RNA-binding protein YhbY [Woeseiaceae bacterium]|nr:ribosome assembly RNA-binding protein YhbY [Woeseiaceae bacterium]
MPLSENQKKHLRRAGHPIKPVVTIGDAGLTDAVLREFDATINHHELIKVKVRAGDRDSRNAIIDSLCQRGEAELVDRIGNVALVFRRNVNEPRVALPGR